MALIDPIERLEPRPRPDWRSAPIKVQFGGMAEDLLAVSLEAAGRGSATIARPIVDRGIDLYLRRLRSLLTIPLQVKAFQHLDADGNGNLDLPVTDISDDTRGTLAIVHLPSPYDQLYGSLFLIPVTEFRERCRRRVVHGEDCFSFTGHFSGGLRDEWSDRLIDINALPEWLSSVTGWATPIPPVPDAPRRHPVLEGDAPMQLRGDIGRLWAATELERAGGGLIAIAEDRVRLDTVTFLLHDLRSRRFAGLHIRTGRVTPDRRFHFEVHRPPFFIDERLYVLVVLLKTDDRVDDFGLLIPSTALSELGYSETITLDPLTKRFEPYRVPSDEVAQVFLKRVFAA
jgi:hypothetical protein